MGDSTLRTFIRGLAVVATSFALACGGSNKGDTTPDPNDQPEPQTRDVAHEYQGETLKGVYFQPEALERPGMPPLAVSKMPTLKAARATVAKQTKKGKLDYNDVHILVTLLWAQGEAKITAGDAAAATPFFEEAATVLRALYDAAGGQAQEYTVYRLAVAEFWLGDQGKATSLLSETLSRFPESEKATEYKTWLAYFQLRAGDNAAAAKLVEGIDPEAEGVGADTAYVVAWSRWRAGDLPGAAKAIMTAANKWKGPVGRDALHRDLMLFMARGGVSAADADAFVTAYVGEQKAVRTLLMYKMGSEGYVFAGRYGEAAAAIDALIEGATEADLVTFRYLQADFHYRAGNPMESAQAALAAWEAVNACAACPAESKATILKIVSDMAVRYHTVYASSLDKSYAEAAKVLYAAYTGIADAPDLAQMQQNQKNLDETISQADAGNAEGTHDKNVMKAVILAHREGLTACYESALAKNPSVGGKLSLTVDVNEKGEVTGAVTEPAAGAEGIASAAQCMIDYSKTWRFPTRTVAGTTRLVYPLTFEPASAAASDEPAAAE